MKTVTQLCAAVLLFVFFTAEVVCVQRIHCQWGPFGSWSECDPCTKSQKRSRAMVTYAQFGGNPCGGGRNEIRTCETTQGCPLEDGCGDRFRCQSGKCVSKSLQCNGDQDCEEDGLDEHNCGDKKYIICAAEPNPPPNIELIGFGFDVVTGKTRGSVINTKSFGGQCRPIFSGVHNRLYRLPLSTIRYSFLVKVQNDFSDEMFSSKWNYAKDIVNRETVTGTTTGFRNYDFHQTHDTTQTHKLLVLKNDIEVAQFQSNSPNYLPIAEEFWKALAKLPVVYDYSAYREILEKFGTHYISEGSLGGVFKAIVSIDEKTEKYITQEVMVHRECERTKRWILFFPITTETCINDDGGGTWKGGTSGFSKVEQVNVEGGGIQQISALKSVQRNDPSKNWEIYSNWADSVRSFPHVIKQKLRSLSELVKEVQCTGVKKLYLRKAIEQYLAESHVCHCQPCRNNGMVVRDGDECKCICKPGTSGLACETGTDVQGQQGVIDGSWSCWSAWSLCSGGRKSRSRSCSNPSPQNGGQYCIGEGLESSRCDDEEELQYLKTMEPQCFDASLPERLKCDTPPSLINGYILNPKDNYFVGDKVEYTCTSGFQLLGNVLECTPDQIWSASPGLCAVSVCKLPLLAADVIAFPSQEAFHLGEIVSLSCPEGKELQGERTSSCDSSLHFSPNPSDVRCIQADAKQKPIYPKVQCQPWEKPSRGNCVCKMPTECSSSLELCARIPENGRFVPLSVCKMHALQCKGKILQIAEYNSCTWSQRNTTGCSSCHMWEDCSAQNNECRCKDSANCLTPGSDVCVRVGEDVTVAPQTMNECEAGLRRCKGEKVSVINIMSCS